MPKELKEAILKVLKSGFGEVTAKIQDGKITMVITTLKEKPKK